METAEFLGGKYQKPEQIRPDPVHTFRTKEVSTGRTVFVHRVSTTEAPAEQTSLLRLLLSAVFRSPSARNLILDYGEEQGFWYVITQGEPQCLQLREWLQFEIDHAGGTAGRTQTSGEAPATSKAPAPADDPDRTQLATPKVGILTPEPPAQSASRESGEFTRMFQPSAKPEASPVWNEPAKPKQQPGEFTRMFLSKTETAAEESKRVPAPPSPDRVNTPPANPEKPPVEHGPGEFTRFFQGASPAAKNPPEPMPAQDPLQTREVQRPSGSVQRAQRPSSPLPQRSSSDTGEFTKLFSRAPESAAPPERRASHLDDIFDRAPAAPSAPPASAPEPGEYTRIFGKGDLGPPAQQPSTIAPQAPASILHDPVAPDSTFPSTKETTRQMPKPAPAAPAPAAQAPSEYTAVMRGLGASGGGAGTPAGEQAHSAPTGAASGMKLPQAPPIPGAQPPKMPAAPMPHKPAVPGGAMPKMKPPEAPKTAAPAPSNKKLIIFFCVLGILTVVLIVLIALIALKK